MLALVVLESPPEVFEDHVELVELGPPAATGLILFRAETANRQSIDQIIFYFWPLEISKIF